MRKLVERVSVADAIHDSHRIPCICARQFEEYPPEGVAKSRTERGHLIVERVECDCCMAEWTRFKVAEPTA